jgi:hypothetical protein
VVPKLQPEMMRKLSAIARIWNKNEFERIRARQLTIKDVCILGTSSAFLLQSDVSECQWGRAIFGVKTNEKHEVRRHDSQLLVTVRSLLAAVRKQSQ